MAKAAILDVLENTIGKYVQNLDAGKLSILLFCCFHEIILYDRQIIRFNFFYHAFNILYNQLITNRITQCSGMGW